MRDASRGARPARSANGRPVVRRAEQNRVLQPIGSLFHGRRALIEATVELTEVVFRGRRNLLVRISDGSGQLTLRFFHFSRQQQAQFQAVAGGRQLI